MLELNSVQLILHAHVRFAGGVKAETNLFPFNHSLFSLVHWSNLLICDLPPTTNPNEHNGSVSTSTFSLIEMRSEQARGQRPELPIPSSQEAGISSPPAYYLSNHRDHYHLSAQVTDRKSLGGFRTPTVGAPHRSSPKSLGAQGGKSGPHVVAVTGDLPVQAPCPVLTCECRRVSVGGGSGLKWGEEPLGGAELSSQ